MRPDQAPHQPGVDQLARDQGRFGRPAARIDNDQIDGDTSPLSRLLGREQGAVQNRRARDPHHPRQGGQQADAEMVGCWALQQKVAWKY